MAAPIPDRLCPRETAGLAGAPSALSGETAEPIVGLWNRGVLVAGIATREGVTAKTESPGNGAATA